MLAPFDAVICPAMPNVAIEHDHRRAEERSVTLRGREYPYVEQVFWATLASLTGCPALVMPAGLSGAGLPVGLQLISTRFSDRRLIAAGRSIESVIGGFRVPPGPWAS